MRTRVAALICSALLVVLATLASATSAQAQPPAPQQAAPQQAAPPPGCTSLEGCYGYADMQAFYDAIIQWIDEFSRATYADMSAPGYVYVDAGTTVVSGCDVAMDSSAYAYCSLDDTVYVGQDQLWDFYTSLGDAAAAVGIAHEWGHHVQSVAGIFPVDQAGAIAKENQADCIAGAWIGYVDAQGRLESDDVGDINAVLQVIAAAEDDGRDHGTLAERTAALQHGFDNGLAGCNAFFPAQPVLS
jgi:predicted metalloprotease